MQILLVMQAAKGSCGLLVESGRAAGSPTATVMQSALDAGHGMCGVVVIEWVAGLREADQSWLLLGDPTNASGAAQMHPTS
jgi:hypothetical protein